MELSRASSTLSPLPPVLSHGLVAVSTFGVLSFCCSFSLFMYLSYRLISWRVKSLSEAPTNQFLFLIYNLLLADIQQSLAFLLNLITLRKNAIEVGSTECWAQGWFVSTGDLSSSVFILAIAIHTFMSVVRQYRLPSVAFYSIVAGCWVFVYTMAIVGPIWHGEDFFVRAGAWCWINTSFQAERLWLHYLWIFIAMSTTICLYTLIFFHLRRSSSRSSNSQSFTHGATPLMILYPLIYTVCTVPLAAGRIAAFAGLDISLAYFCVAGSMIACNGWLDVLLYASTRSEIVFSDDPPSEETGLDTFTFPGVDQKMRMGTVTTVEGGSEELGGRHGRNGSALVRRSDGRSGRDLGRRNDRRSGSAPGRRNDGRNGSRSGRHNDGRRASVFGRRKDGNESSENLYGLELGQIGVKESVEVTVERYDEDMNKSRGRKGSSGGMSGSQSLKGMFP